MGITPKRPVDQGTPPRVYNVHLSCLLTSSRAALFVGDERCVLIYRNEL